MVAPNCAETTTLSLSRNIDKDLNNVRVVRVADYHDESISRGFFAEKAETVEEVYADFRKTLANGEIRDFLNAVKLGRGSVSQVSTEVSPWAIEKAAPFTKASLFNLLLGSLVDPGVAEKAAAIVKSVYTRSDLSAVGVQEFLYSFRVGTSKVLGQIFSLAESQDSNIWIAQTSVDGVLRNIAKDIENHEIREKYLASDISGLELLGVLQYATSAQRIEFLRVLHTLALQNEEVRSYAATKLDNVLAYVNTLEKIEVISEILASSSASGSYEFVNTMVKASKDLDELVQIVSGIGEDVLLGTGNEALRGYVAHAVLGPELRAASMPEKLSEDASTEEIDRTLDGIKEAIQERMGILSAYADQTTVVQEYTAIAEYNHAYLEEKHASAESYDELRLFANLMIEKLPLEFKYCIKLSHEQPGLRIILVDGNIALVPTAGAEWSESEIVQVKLAFEAYTEGILLTTPLLAEIARTEAISDGVMGARFPDGLIKISNEAVDNGFAAILYPGNSTLYVTLVHEIAHGIQLGQDGGGVLVGDEGSTAFTLGDLRYEFEEFLALSGWSVVHPSRYSVTNEGLSVVLDGVEYPVRYPIIHDGQEITLVFGHGTLFSYDTYGPFSLWAYGRSNPWEDWAVAFTDYRLFPERLITFAPEKFKFFDQEFGFYRERSDLQDLCATKLRERAKLRHQEEPYIPETEAELVVNLPQ